MRYKTLVVVLTVAALGINGLANAEETVADLLRYVPREAEVVIGVDVHRITTHPAFDKLYQSLDTTELDAGIVFLQSVAGIHLLNDIDAIVLASEMRENGKGVIYLKGSWDADHLVSLVAANPTYVRRETSGPDIHVWQDENSGKMSHAVFLRDDLLAMSEWMEVVQRVVQTAAGTASSLKGTETPRKSDGSPTEAFLLAFRPNDPYGDIRANPVLSRLRSVAVGLQVKEDSVTVSARAEAEEDHSAALLSRVLDGLIALGELAYNGERQMPSAAATHKGSRVEAVVNVPLETLIDAARTSQLQRMENAG